LNVCRRIYGDNCAGGALKRIGRKSACAGPGGAGASVRAGRVVGGSTGEVRAQPAQRQQLAGACLAAAQRRPEGHRTARTDHHRRQPLPGRHARPVLQAAASAARHDAVRRSQAVDVAPLTAAVSSFTPAAPIFSSVSILLGLFYLVDSFSGNFSQYNSFVFLSVHSYFIAVFRLVYFY